MPSKTEDTSINAVELKTWRQAALIMLALAITIFCAQRFIGQMFDFAFEICIFYIPAILLIIVYFYFKARLIKQ